MKTLLGAEVRPTPTSQESEIGLQVCAQSETGKQSPDPGGDAHPHLGRPQGGVNISQEKGVIQDTQESRDLEVGEGGTDSGREGRVLRAGAASTTGSPNPSSQTRAIESV